MGLHIRDYRQSDGASLSELLATGRPIGQPPPQGAVTRILVGLRNTHLVGAAWIACNGETGLVAAILAEAGAGWPSNALELIAQAGLWLTSRGAACIELQGMPDDHKLRLGLAEMGFEDLGASDIMRRAVPARSAA